MFYVHHELRGFWAILCKVKSIGHFVYSPSYGQNLNFAPPVKEVAVEPFISHPTVGCFAISAIQRRSFVDLGGLRPDRWDPIQDCLRNTFRAIVGLDEGWHATWMKRPVRILIRSIGLSFCFALLTEKRCKHDLKDRLSGS